MGALFVCVFIAFFAKCFTKNRKKCKKVSKICIFHIFFVILPPDCVLFIPNCAEKVIIHSIIGALVRKHERTD